MNKTPNLNELVQEVIDRPGWVAKNSISFIITGTGRRVAETHDAIPASAAVLHILYTPGPPNFPPTVNWTSPVDGQVFNDLSPINFQANATDPENNITQLEFFVNGVSVGIDVSSSLFYDLDTSFFGKLYFRCHCNRWWQQYYY